MELSGSSPLAGFQVSVAPSMNPSLEPAPTPPQGDLRGRCCSRCHPIQGCTLGGMLFDLGITAVGGVGAYLLHNINTLATVLLGITAGYGAFSTVKDGCASLYLCSWKPKKKLEQAVEETTKAAETLRKKVQDLNGQIATLHETREGLEHSLAHEREQTTALNQTIREHAEQLHSLEQRARELQEALDKTVALKTSWQRIAQAVSAEVVSFHEKVKPYVSSDVEAHIGDLQTLSQKAEVGLQEGAELVERISQARAGWISLIRELSDKFVILKGDIDTKAAQIQAQSDSIRRLEEANTRFEANMKAFEPIREQMRTIAELYRKAQADLVKVEGVLRPLLELPEGSTLTYVREVAQRAISEIQKLR